MRRRVAWIQITIWSCGAIGGAGGAGTATAQAPPNAAARHALLPPVPPWAGASRALIAKADDPWITPSEQSGFAHHAELRRDDGVARAAGRGDAAGRRWSRSARARRGAISGWWWSRRRAPRRPRRCAANGRPTLLAQAGIHAGEIDGKDAGTDAAARPDGRAARRRACSTAPTCCSCRSSTSTATSAPRAYGRINQRGPEATGWRTTAAQPESEPRLHQARRARDARAWWRRSNAWAPDLYFDLHVTDGIDYQYDITFGWNGRHG